MAATIMSSSLSLKPSTVTIKKHAAKGLPSLTKTLFTVRASDVKKIKTDQPFSIGGGMALKDGKDTSGRKPKCPMLKPSNYSLWAIRMQIQFRRRGDGGFNQSRGQENNFKKETDSNSNKFSIKERRTDLIEEDLEPTLLMAIVEETPGSFVNQEESRRVGSENLDGGVTESMSRPGIKEDIYAARTPIGRQSVGSITNQKHDQSGFMIDHNNEGGSNQKNIDLPGCKDDHKHYKKSKQYPIYSEEWSPSGDVYVGGTTGLLIWAVTLAGILRGGALLVYSTSAQ
ncbi:zinc finger, CCHC-type containing protein [Tanacetum coccineum]|uniref:Photosystem II 10 kDa polypeptide, chloroplastic n=1 Tax=Tanacetum coccineum TaxID=301880 RepID=A0ABQ5C5V8_9ASTR